MVLFMIVKTACQNCHSEYEQEVDQDRAQNGSLHHFELIVIESSSVEVYEPGEARCIRLVLHTVRSQFMRP